MHFASSFVLRAVSKVKNMSDCVRHSLGDAGREM